MAELVSIVMKPSSAEPVPDGYTRIPLPAARLVVGRGIEGDAKGSTRNRQLNIMAADTVAELRKEGYRADPGQLGEQLILSGIDVDRLAAGTRIQIGESACVEVGEPRTGCSKFERYQGKRIRESSGRLGMMARVVEEGEIRLGDTVRVLETTERGHD